MEMSDDVVILCFEISNSNHQKQGKIQWWWFILV